ncbi:MAG: WD40 repeat domain-containing serine/threonine protein kinase [Actinomadura sp.]
MPDPRSLRLGDPERLGRYRLVGLLGEGAQGTVFLGEAPDGLRVAVKVLHARIAGDDRARRRLIREVAAARQVRQFCTAQVLDVATTGDSFFIVSEYVPGESLKQLVDREGPRDGGALERLAVGTASALAAIHQAGIVHRDFKPQNVLMGPDGPRVIDFGIARTLDATASETSGPVGTPAYMAPEQITNGEVDPSSDVFSWGGTMVFAATGSPAFGRDSVPVVMYRILHESPDLSGVPDPLRDVVAAALAKQPGQRPTATEALLSMLGDGQASAARRLHPDTVAPHRPDPHRLDPERFDPYRVDPRRQPRGDLEESGPLEVDYGALLDESLGVEHPASAPAPDAAEDVVTGPVPVRRRGRWIRWLAAGASALALIGTAFIVPAMVRRSGPVTLSGHSPAVSGVAFSPDGKTLTTVDSQSARWWDVASHQRVGAPLNLTLLLSAVAFSPDRTVLVTGGGDEMVRLWDVETHGLIASLNHDAGVYALAFSPDGRTLATGGDDGTVRLWDVATRRQVAVLTHQGGVYAVSALAFSPNGGTLATGGGDGTLRLWDVAARREIGHAPTGRDGSDYGVDTMMFSSDGRTLATGGGDGLVRLWDVTSRPVVVATLTGHEGTVNTVVFSPDGGTLATGGDDRMVRLWDVAVRRQISGLNHEASVYAVAFSPDGRTLAAGGTDDAVRLWQVPSTTTGD